MSHKTKVKFKQSKKKSNIKVRIKKTAPTKKRKIKRRTRFANSGSTYS